MIYEICYSQVKHDARVTIDEKGCTATAYTVMMMAGAGRPPEEEVNFVLDKPFLFAITNHSQLRVVSHVTPYGQARKLPIRCTDREFLYTFNDTSITFISGYGRKHGADP